MRGTFSSLWTFRLGILASAAGAVLALFMRGDGPDPHWSFLEQAGQCLAAGFFLGCFGVGLGLVCDLLGFLFRKYSDFSQAMREQNERFPDPPKRP